MSISLANTKMNYIFSKFCIKILMMKKNCDQNMKQHFLFKINKKNQTIYFRTNKMYIINLNNIYTFKQQYQYLELQLKKNNLQTLCLNVLDRYYFDKNIIARIPLKKIQFLIDLFLIYQTIYKILKSN
ncbi:hypothetical protein TTHERM_000793975 (macronuclear) [Tetrahymena thermophila SB210]|uniref:Uncharacterized protein n=1 Tax=Tetrahymena thermophila (strain SB210) TaxID=312017 RepID=W7XGC9_TETTS|nr:hypothetical protein TTHERM_000793975 [Tetrahymena thermophila SB210]EWS73166.1 hypothetical protein TTHERM_000793975 [Tetrahymena thermophila SB210]|eukprot:XP_012654286.1 hypothetical protein TTHERM_000793975 [Tetrahymena thermophila SB210]